MEHNIRKILGAGLGAAALLVPASSAGAASCVNGVYRAGCAGPNGAVAVHKPYTAPPRAMVATSPHAVVVTRPPVAHCYYMNGRRVCS